MSETDKQLAQMRRLIYGNWPMCVTYAFAELGIADFLIDGRRTTAELSELTQINSDYLARFLRCCLAVSFIEINGTLVSLTPFGQLLSSHHPQSQRNIARLNGAAYRYEPWGNLVSILCAGSPALFSPSFKNGTLAYLSDKPEQLKLFEEAMCELSATEDEMLARAYNFDRFAYIIDIGAGSGSLLKEVLQHHTKVHGTMFDLKINDLENNFW